MLEAHPAVDQVFFPGLKNDPYHEIACKQMDDFGGMIALELKGGYEAGVRMLNKLKLAKLAVSLGDAETLIQHPASMTHSVYTLEERAKHGITEGLIGSAPQAPQRICPTGHAGCLAKRVHRSRSAPHLPHVPGGGITVAQQTPSNYRWVQ